MKLYTPIQGIIHAKFDNQFDLAFTFMRIQECYEHRDQHRQNKFFTLEEVIENYAEEGPTGKFSYLDDWHGFNLNGESLEVFKTLYKNDLTKKEKALIEIVERAVQYEEAATYDGKYYLIGTVSDIYLDHEIAHGMYHLYADYKKDSDKLTRKLPKSYRTAVYAMLKDYGYADNVLDDELNAYVATSDMYTMRESVFEHFKPTAKIKFSWDRLYPHVENYWDWKHELEIDFDDQRLKIP